MPSTVLECVGLCKSFTQTVVPIKRLQDHILQAGRGKERMRIDAVTDVNLVVEKGEWVGLFGPNGSGKSTFMQLLAGLLVPDKGHVKRKGRISNFELGIGFHPERNAKENMYLHGLLQGMSPRQIAKTMERTLAFADIGKHAALPMKCLSTGMAMRLSFAAVAQVEADIYLFDEVLAVGDEKFQRRCFEHLSRLRDQGKTAIIVSHDFDGLMELCDRVVFFSQGKITGQRKWLHTKEEREKDARRLTREAAAEARQARRA